VKIIYSYIIFTLFFGHLTTLSAFDKKPTELVSKSKAKKVGVVFFDGTFKQAMVKAQSENKMIFIDSYTSWCGPCKQMKYMLKADEKLGNYLNENFVCLSVNIEKGEGPRLKRKYPHGTFPTLLFIKNDGRLKNRFSGLPEYGPAELLNFAKLASQ
jgi:thioredoxin 1